MKDLLRLHIEALFTFDICSKMVSINEPWDKSKPAPSLYIGKTVDGEIICRFGSKIQPAAINELEYYLKKEAENKKAGSKFLEKYKEILKSVNHAEEIAYYFDCDNLYFSSNTSESCREEKTVDMVCEKITESNIEEYVLADFEWLREEIKYSQPCYGIISGGKVLSICRSVRITNEAHEAGIETSKEYRGKGFAKKVLVLWAIDVKNSGCVPLYSTSKGNASSQGLAEKTSLKKIGTGTSIG
jgi:hypothetical protein